MLARQAARKAAEAARKISTSAIARGGSHEPAYVHAKNMYNIQGMTNRKLKFGSAILGTVVLGCAVPWIAAEIQFARMKG